MAPPLRSTAEVPAPLAVADSERTLFLQRRIGRIGMDNNKRRSAYFADSDASATSGGGGGGGGEPSATLPQRAVAARVGSAVAVPASGSTRVEGRWILGGIRHSYGQLRENQPQPQYRDTNAFGNGLGMTARTRNPRTSEDGDDQKRDRRGGAAVFHGSIRFPASRVALWNRRPTGSPVTLTPESAAPILVLRQSAADAIASKLSSLAEGAHERSPSAHFRWNGVLGSAADALRGRAASDPRAASTLSSAAVEIVGLGDETSRSLRGVGVFAASARAHERRQSEPRRARAIALSGALLTTEEEEEGRVGEGGAGGLVLDEGYYRAVLDDCTKVIGGAKSASPEVFTPLRLQCSLKGHRAAASGDGSRRRSRGRDGSEASSLRPRRARQASVRATLSLRGEMVVPGVGVRLTPIASLALLHTALYQSLLTRGADEKLQSGLLTLNEGRRAVLLSDNDPLSFRAHIVGVWVSGRTGDGSSSSSGSGSGGPGTPGGQQQHRHGRQPSLLGHPFTYPACLRFLLGTHRGNSGGDNGNGGGGGGGGGGGASRPAATPGSFLVLHLPGGVDGGTPAFFEACALSNGKAASATVGRGLDVRSAGFEQLDFSADIDVAVGGGGTGEDGGGEPGGGRRGGGREGGGGGGGGSGGGGGDDSANRAIVIGRLRRVLKPSLAEPFGRALDEAMGRQRATPQLARDTCLRSSAPATPAAPAATTAPTATAATVAAVPPSQPQRHAGDQGARWHSRHHATSAGADNAEAPPLDEPLDEPLAAPAPIAPPIKPTAVNAPSASLHSGQNGGVPASVGRVSVPAAAAVVTPSPLQHHQGAGVNQHPFQTLGVGAIGESSVVGGGRGGGSALFLEDETFEREGKTSIPTPRASGAGDGAGVGAWSPLLPPSPPLPLPPLDGGGQPDGALVPWHGSLDLLALDPAARVYFLAQQRQLSALEHQLRRLQATMHDKQQQQPPQPQQQPQQQQHQNQNQQLHSLPQQRSPLQPVRLSVDHPFLSVSSSGPAVGIHATAAAAATVAVAAAAEQAPADRQALPLPLSESGKETRTGEMATDQAIEASASGARVPMVEVGTNTSFLWGPAVPPPPPLSKGASEECRIGSDPSPPAATAAAAATATAVALSRSVGARTLTGSIAPGGHAASAPPPAGNAVRNKPAQEREVGSWTLPPTERRSAHSSPASRSGESAAAMSSGWTTQRGHAAEGDSQRQRRRRRRQDGRGRGDGGRGDESGGNVTGDSISSGSEGKEEALERAPPLMLRLLGEISHVTSPNDRDRERWCHVPQRVVASPLAKGGDKDKDDVAARRGRQVRRQGRRLSTYPPAAREARETAVKKIDPSTSDDDGRRDRESDSSPAEEVGGGKKRGVTVVCPNRNVYDEGASRLSPTTATKRNGGGGTTERGKATGNDFEGGGEVLHRRWRPLEAGYRGSVDVVPVTIAELAVVPRIEFDHLTDDELGFDLDEGETIFRIESKYLKGGSMARTRGKQQ